MINGMTWFHIAHGQAKLDVIQVCVDDVTVALPVVYTSSVCSYITKNI
jgi:hypothetical protein